MSLQARIKTLERVIDEVGDTIEGLIEIAEAYEERSVQLQKRVTSLEEELRIPKPGVSTTN